MAKEAPRRLPDGIDGLMAEALGRDGVFTTEDARRWEVSPAALTRAINKGRLLRLFPRVYVVAGANTTWWTHARASAAWSNGALSHLSAAFALGLIESPPAEIDVVAATIRRAPAGTPLHCHHSRLVSPPHVITVRGIPVTAAARTLLDIAPLVSEDVLEGALEDALRRGFVSMARLEWQLRTEGRKGRAGTAALRKLLRARGPQHTTTESILETKLARWFRSTRLPPPVRQHRVVAGGRFIARIDFAYPDARIAIEAKSYRWHSGRRDWLRDEDRHRDLKDLGWQVIYVTDEDISTRGPQLEAEIAEPLGITLF
jgi:very-short-patch-repair endonuclease